jgi:dihydrofolate reductase
MRKVILSVAVSLDGFIEGPKGEYDWCTMDPEYDFSEFFNRIDTVFVGRKTYEMSQQMEGGPSGFPKFKEYVFSTTLYPVKKDAILISGDLANEVEKIKRDKGKDIWLFGGAALTTSFLNLGLIDELSLAMYPVILGGGKPLFNHLLRRTLLRLLHAKQYSSGLLGLTYAVNKQELP